MGEKSHGNIFNSWTDFYPKDTMLLIPAVALLDTMAEADHEKDI